MSTRPPVNIFEVAERAGVALGLVYDVIFGRAAVPEAVRRRVQALLDESDRMTIPGKEPRTIGIAVPGVLVDDYIGQVARGVIDYARRLGYSVQLNRQNTTQQDSLDALLAEGGCDGVVVIMPLLYDKVMTALRRYGRPYVLVDYEGDEPGAPVVMVDNRQAIIDTMQYLFALGHRRIGFITGYLHVESARQRLFGYQDALVAAGLPLDDDLIDIGDWTHRSGHDAATRLLQHDDPPTAILASNDFIAMGVLQAAHELGRQVPGDLSVVGFDDVPQAAQTKPPLTTVRQPAVAMGGAALESLALLLEGMAPTHGRQIFETELIVRKSTGPRRN